ncbi:sugar phosphate isomerase/epimerase family protein [Paenibacillus sp. MMO-177]|uniref:sugar phosphate isomerase/epimerase family protein n=1 Tax=Paenibacillus sp. MMO-177 TaxID=3081289 RepID=UPI003018C128
MNIKFGIQLYTLRDLTVHDFKGTLEKVAALGYEGVEFAGYGGMEANGLKELLDRLGMEAAGSHVRYERALTSLDEEIAYNKRIGNRNLIIPYYDGNKFKEDKEREKFYANLKTMGQKCAESDMQLLYHNHEFEFTIQLDDKTMFDHLFENVDNKLLQAELDSCWAYRAGFDPAAVIRQYKDRMPLVHLKDMRRSNDGQVITVELGQGEVKLNPIVDASIESGVQWLIVEQDECQDEPLASIATSMKWIRNHYGSTTR